MGHLEEAILSCNMASKAETDDSDKSMISSLLGWITFKQGNNKISHVHLKEAYEIDRNIGK